MDRNRFRVSLLLFVLAIFSCFYAVKDTLAFQSFYVHENLKTLFFPKISEINRARASIAFVHIGKELPPYLDEALIQARLFNKVPILVVAKQSLIKKKTEFFKSHQITGIPSESLWITKWHRYFKKHSPLGPFWFETLERFFLIDELMHRYQLSNVFHLESDNMLYTDIEELLPTMRRLYQDIGATFDADHRCIPGIIFFRKPASSRHMIQYLAKTAPLGFNDMESIPQYRGSIGSKQVTLLPIAPFDYFDHFSVESNNPSDFITNIEAFHSIFDAAYIGQYLGGIDPRHQDIRKGFVNETCVVKAPNIRFFWEKDEKNRWIPYGMCKGKAYRINNLHIHSKRLHEFNSLRTHE